jgi:hypothetical protein
MSRIVLRSWSPGLRKISLVHVLQEEAGLSLTAAKESVDDLLAGKVVTVDIPEERKPLTVAEQIRSLGVICDIIGP